MFISNKENMEKWRALRGQTNSPSWRELYEQRPRDPIKEAKEQICWRVERMTGLRQTMSLDYLSILTGPDVLPMLKQLIEMIEADEEKNADG